MSSSAPATEHTALGGNAGAGYGAADHEVDVGPLAQSLTAHETRAVDVAVSEVQRRRDKEKRVLTGAMIFCFVFMVLEFVAGVIAHSLALLTDALHLLTDVGAYGLSIAALVTASRVACGKYNYGWHRAEVIGTLISVFSIWALVLWIVVEAVQRIYDIIACSRVPGQLVAHEMIKTEQIVKGKVTSSATSGVTLPGEAVRQCTAIDSRLMIVVGFLGMLVNIVCASILYFGGAHGHSHGGGASHGHSHGSHGHGHDDHAHDHDHDHDHDHGHDHGHGSGDSERGFAVRSAILHALGDCIQSLGVILAGFYIYAANQYSFKTHSYKYSLHNLADPLASIFFAVVTVNMTRSLLMDLLGILMETTPPGVDYQGLEAALRQINGVKSVHDLHVWSLSPDYAALSVHLVAEAEDVQQAILKKAKELIKGRFGISHSTIQVDCEGTEGDRCAGGCELPEDCKSPLINHRH